MVLTEVPSLGLSRGAVTVGPQLVAETAVDSGAATEPIVKQHTHVCTLKHIHTYENTHMLFVFRF